MDTISGYLMRMPINRPITGNTKIQIVVFTGAYAGIKKIPEEQLAPVKHRRLHPDIVAPEQRLIISPYPLQRDRRLQGPTPLIDPVVAPRYKYRIRVVPEIIKIQFQGIGIQNVIRIQ